MGQKWNKWILNELIKLNDKNGDKTGFLHAETYDPMEEQTLMSITRRTLEIVNIIMGV